MSDFLYTVLWVFVYATPSFLIQLLLCFKTKNTFFRYTPAYIAVRGVIYTVDTYFNFSGMHHGWNELAAFFVGCYVAIYCFGIVMAWIVYYILKRKKR